MDEGFMMKFGQLYEDIKYENKWARSYFLVFMIRRILYVTFAFYVLTPILQILCLFFSNQAALIYHGSIMPAQSRFENRLNLFNEFFITSTCLTVVFYTAWIGDAMLEYNLGWVTIMLTLFTTLINLLNLIYFSVKFVYDFVRR